MRLGYDRAAAGTNAEPPRNKESNQPPKTPLLQKTINSNKS